MLLTDGPRDWLREEAHLRHAVDETKERKPKELMRKEKEFVKVLNLVEASKIFDLENDAPSARVSLDWDRLAKVDVDQGPGRLPLDRRLRKRQQIENMVSEAAAVAKKGATVVDFCCGVGHQALVLAVLRPDLKIVLVDRDATRLSLAQHRADDAGVELRIVQSTVANFQEHFDVGIALHACGPASDDVIQKCLDCKAAFVVAPCCVGLTLRRHRRPQSYRLQNLIGSSSYSFLVKAADTNPQSLAKTNLNRLHRKCKTILELDRLAKAHDLASYDTRLVRMTPITATPKNDILIGQPPII